jgi:broad specificity phosphatase PhoE
MELLLIRHALPLRVDAADAGPADPGLAPQGWEQARALADWLKAEELHGIIAGPSRRARETAQPLAVSLGLEPVVDGALAEFDAAAASYVPLEELRALGDDRWQAVVRGDFYTPDVDPVAFRERIVARLEEIVAAHPGQRLAVFTNAGIICAYTGHVLHQPPSPPLWFGPGYTSISRVGAARDGRRGIISLNETAHIRDLRG